MDEMRIPAQASSVSRVAYVNARLADPASGIDAAGGLLTEGKTIAAVAPGLFAGGAPEDAEVIDCRGAVLAPGLVDMRVQACEPGFSHKESFESAGRAAVAGGITSMAVLPHADPVADDVATLEFVARRARQVGLSKCCSYAAATKKGEGKELSEMGLLAQAGAVAFTDGVKAVASAAVMRRILQYAATFGFLIVQHPEEPTLASGVMNAGALATRLGLSGIPREAESIMLERDMRLVAMTGGRYHAAHLSTADGVEIIRAAKARGIPVTCDTAPPYFALNELAVGDYRTFAKLLPPLRSEDDRRAIVGGLRDGTIDAIASDHVPQDQDSKRLPFAQAEFGGIGLDTLLPLTLELVHQGTLTLLEALRLLTCSPAALLGLDVGRLRPGGAADLVLIDFDRPWKYDARQSLSKSKNSPFDGRLLQGLAVRTVVDGRAVFVR